jgi:hypothetical protein
MILPEGFVEPTDYEQIKYETWGHLLPAADGKIHRVEVIAGVDSYGYQFILKERHDSIESSPWYYHSMVDALDQSIPLGENGAMYEIHYDCQVIDIVAFIPEWDEILLERETGSEESKVEYIKYLRFTEVYKVKKEVDFEST